MWLHRQLQLLTLGGGGCSLPLFLGTALGAQLAQVIVEASPDVCAAARACFGVAEAEAAGNLQLMLGRAEQCLEGSSRDADVVIIDLEDEGRAPPLPLCTDLQRKMNEVGWSALVQV